MDSNSTGSRVELHVSELQVGMYVSQLDCDWLDTPFLLQGFLIESEADIDALCEHCEHVWVDANTQPRRPYEAHATLRTSSNARIKIHKVASADQIAKTRQVYEASHSATRQIFNDIRMGSAINTEVAKQTVKDCVDSIITDPDTMMLMIKMRERDEYTTEHSMNVCVLAIAFGRAMQFTPLELNHIGICGLLHDIGKMSVPDHILHKPGQLEGEEWEIMMSHAEKGRDILLQAKGIYHGAVDAAYSHHEKVDGTGYPRGLESAGISQYAKMIAICDAYDAMTATRCYSEAIAPTAALKRLYDARDSHFDARLVDTFMTMVGVYPPGSVVELKNGSIGIVISRNLKYQHLPKIMLVRDEQKQPCPERVVNLSDVEAGRLGDGYLIAHDHTDGSFEVFLKDYLDKGLAIAM